jgi:uncharacterized protein YndB with AHSA1/START domain
MLVAGGLLLLVSVAGLWLAGGRQQVFHAEVVVAAPPDAAFAWLTEPPRLARWLGGFVESRPLGDGVLRVGARSVDVVEQGGRRVEMQTEVLALEPGRLLEVSIEAPFLTGSNRFALSAEEGGTRLAQTLTIRERGPARLFALLVRGAVQAKLAADLERLRQATATR